MSSAPTAPQTSVPNTPGQVPFSSIDMPQALPPVSGYSELITIPANDAPAGSVLQLSVSLSPPRGIPSAGKNLNAGTSMLYIGATTANTVQLQGMPAFSVTLPESVQLGQSQVLFAFYDPASGWKSLGDATVSGMTISYAGSHNAVTLKAGSIYGFLAYSPQQVAGCPTPPPTPVPTPTPAPTPTPTIAPTPTGPKIYIGEAGGTPRVVYVYDENGNLVTTTGSFPNAGAGALLWDPFNRHLYISNPENSVNDIAVYDENGNPVATSGDFPNVDFAGELAQDTFSRKLYAPNAGSGSITSYDEQGNQLPISGFVDPNDPGEMAFDPSNREFYVSNFSNNSVSVFDENGNAVRTTGSFPNPSTTFGSPLGIAIDTFNHRVYIVWNQGTKGGAIGVYDENGNPIATAGTFPNLGAPAGIAFDTSLRRLYVTNNMPLNFNAALTIYDENGNRIIPSGSFTAFGTEFDGITISQ